MIIRKRLFDLGRDGKGIQ